MKPPAVELPPSVLRRLAGCLEEALTALGAAPTRRQLDDASVTILAAMSGPARRYHTIEHVFDVCEGAPPLVLLALLFHDTVCLHLDDGLPPHAQPRLEGVVEPVAAGRYRLRAYDPGKDRVRGVVEAVFGVAPGEELPAAGGVNELLSALLACRSLEPLLSLAQLTGLAGCVEATIPFRGAAGVCPAEGLFTRLQRTSEDFALGLDDGALRRAVDLAVETSNRDIGNFAVEDTRGFLDNTWRILGETPSLRDPRRATHRTYRTAIEKMEGFLAQLDPRLVFHGFRGRPDAASLRRLRERAGRNIARVVRYLRVKRLAVGLLEALALETGGDAPMELFLGDIPGEGVAPRLERALPDHANRPTSSGLDPWVLSVLDEGDLSARGFDLLGGPLPAFVYRGLGDAALDEILELAEEALARAGRARELLQAFPRAVVQAVARAAGQVADSRAAALDGLAAGL